MRFLLSLFYFFKSINDGLMKFCRVASIFAMAGMLTVVVIGVFFRYVLNDSLTWGEEIAKFLMLWLCFLGAPYVLRMQAFVAIDILLERMGKIPQKFFFFINMLVTISVLILLIYQGTIQATRAMSQVITTVDWIPMGVPYSAVPVGAFLMLLVSLEALLGQLTNNEIQWAVYKKAISVD